MFKKVMKGIFVGACTVIGAIGGAGTAIDLMESVADLMHLKEKDNPDPVESAEEEA